MENEIRDFFRATAPQPGDEAAFRLELNARLAAAEQIKQYRDREARRLRRIGWGIFAAGLVLGGALAALLILKPFKFPEFLSGQDLAAAVPGAPWMPFWVFAILPVAFLAAFLPIKRSHRKHII